MRPRRLQRSKVVSYNSLPSDPISAIGQYLAIEQGAVFNYHYDFGDGWRHIVAVEEFLTLAATPKHGSCVAGERARPPEDVGGISGYDRFLEIIADREDPEYAETIRWCGGYFDPEWFDLSTADKDLRSVACCRFHGYRVKVFFLKPESMNAKTNIQPRV